MPRMTVLRVLVLTAFMYACVKAYDALPFPVRSVMVFVALFGGSMLLHFMARKDPIEQKPVEDPQPVDRQVWRVRLWVRLVAVAVPLAGLPFVSWPQLPVVALYLALGLVAWAAFRSRLELDESWVRVTNPWESRMFLRSSVRSARQGPWGMELVLDDGSVVTVFALQCVGSRWVAAARAVTGRDPVTG